MRSLIDLSCSTVEAHIRALSISELLRLPLIQRYQLLDYLSALDVLRLTESEFTEGLDEEKIWEGRCEGTGIDFTHFRDQDPPKHKVMFSTSIAPKDVYFLSLWTGIDRVIKSAGSRGVMDDLMTLLFSDKMKRDYSKRIPNALGIKLKALTSAESEALPNDSVTMSNRDCMRDVLILVLESGYRPSYISYNALMTHLEMRGDHDLLEKVLSKVTAVATPGQEMTKMWFEILLENAMPTLKLGVKDDCLSHICSCMQRAAERKGIEQLVLYIMDEEIHYRRLAGFLRKMSVSHQITLLELVAPNSKINRLSNVWHQHLKYLISYLLDFIQMPTFQCLRLYGVVTSTAAKNLISTFLSTPCSSPQSLELDRMHLDTGSTFHENEQNLLMKNTFYRFKTLVIDSIDIEDAESLGMHKYLRIKSSRLQNSCSGKIDSSFASISDWLLTQPNLKIGFLELRDYAYVTNDICIPSTATIENMKLFITVVRDAQGQWKSQLFFTALTNPSLQELTWHCRYSVKFFSERFLKSSAFTELLSSSIINHPPRQSLTKLTITINNVFDYKQVHYIVTAAFPNCQFQCYTAAEEQRPQNN